MNENDLTSHPKWKEFEEKDLENRLLLPGFERNIESDRRQKEYRDMRFLMLHVYQDMQKRFEQIYAGEDDLGDVNAKLCALATELGSLERYFGAPPPFLEIPDDQTAALLYRYKHESGRIMEFPGFNEFYCASDGGVAYRLQVGGRVGSVHPAHLESVTVLRESGILYDFKDMEGNAKSQAIQNAIYEICSGDLADSVVVLGFNYDKFNGRAIPAVIGYIIGPVLEIEDMQPIIPMGEGVVYDESSERMMLIWGSMYDPEAPFRLPKEDLDSAMCEIVHSFHQSISKIVDPKGHKARLKAESYARKAGSREFVNFVPFRPENIAYIAVLEERETHPIHFGSHYS